MPHDGRFGELGQGRGGLGDCFGRQQLGEVTLGHIASGQSRRSSSGV